MVGLGWAFPRACTICIRSSFSWALKVVEKEEERERERDARHLTDELD